MVAPITSTGLSIIITFISCISAGSISLIVFLLMFTLFILPSTLWLVKRIIDLDTSTLTITDKKIIFEHGLFFRVNQEHFLNRIDTISVRQGLLGRTFGYGNIEVSGTGTKLGRKTYISNPIEVKNIIQNAIKNYGNSTVI